MARRWTADEEAFYRFQLEELYIRDNKTIREIGAILQLHEASVYARLLRLGISVVPEGKKRFCNRKFNVRIPKQSPHLAEFIGMMLGDGCITRYQLMMTLGTKEKEYVEYTRALMTDLFNIDAKVITSKYGGYHIVYISSKELSTWLQDMGLVFNKVASQVTVPEWIFTNKEYMSRFVRGFFDTDGSIYKLRFGIQMSFTNKSTPILLALQSMLKSLGYSVSAISAWRIYITRRDEVERFFREIQPQNQKHCRRLDKFCVGGGVVNRNRL